MPEVNPMNDALEQISEIQLAVQRIEALMPTFQADMKQALTAVQRIEGLIPTFQVELKKALAKELEAAGELVKSGLEKNGEIQFWDLVSSIVNNALGLLILGSLIYLVCKQCSNSHRKPPKTLIFTKPNNQPNDFNDIDLESQQAGASLRMSST